MLHRTETWSVTRVQRNKTGTSEGIKMDDWSDKNKQGQERE